MGRRIGAGGAPRRSLAWLGVLVGILACRSVPEPVAAPIWLPGSDAVRLEGPVAPFSGVRVIERSRELASARGVAPTGEDRAKMREAIVDDLAALGIPSEVWALGPAPRVTGDDEGDPRVPRPYAPHAVLGVLDGRSSDVILLVAGDDPREPVGTSREPVDRVSGAAALLELGRVIAARPRPYTVWLCFLDGGLDVPEPREGRRDDGVHRMRDEAWRSPPDDAAGFVTTGLFIDALESRGDRDRVRVVLLFDSLFDPDLHVDRDLRSHRVHRETFWDSARALGLEDVFPGDAPFASPRGPQVVWLDAGYRGVVAIVGAEPWADIGMEDVTSSTSTPRDEASTEAAIARRLDEFGVVALDAIDRIGSRFERIDGFSRSPITSERWEGEPPVPEATPIERSAP